MTEPNDLHFSSVVSEGDIVKKKKGGLEHKLRDIFISPDVDDIGDYVVWSIIVPGIKNILSDSFHGMVDGIFGRRRQSSYTSSYRYGRDRDTEYYRPRDYSSRYERRESERPFTSGSDIIFRSRAKAEEVRDTLYEIIDRRGYVTLAHLNDLVDIPYGDRDRDDDLWGWYEISRSRIKPTREGFLLDLPRPERIKERR